jgi:hypothetical protein
MARYEQIAGAVAALVLWAAAAGPANAQTETSAQTTEAPTQTTVTQRDPQSASRTPPAALSIEESEFLLQRKREIEKGAGAKTLINPPSPAGLPPVAGKGTELITNETKFPFAPGSMVILRNNQNPPTLAQSTLAEPAAANNGAQVLATGNFRHFEFSINGGASWTKSIFPAGPPDAPSVCCDNDVIHDRGRGVTFLSALYVNRTLNHGVVRIFVRRNINTAPNCSYTINPGGAILPDYPHKEKATISST